jgi:hypothetical protein
MYRVSKFYYNKLNLYCWSITLCCCVQVLQEGATDLFSQRVAGSMGLQAVRQIRYCHCTAEHTGEVAFSMLSPHDTLKIMVKVLQ